MLSINTVKVTAAPTPPAMTFAVGTLVIVYMSISFLICSADLNARLYYLSSCASGRRATIVPKQLIRFEVEAGSLFGGALC